MQFMDWIIAKNAYILSGNHTISVLFTKYTENFNENSRNMEINF